MKKVRVIRMIVAALIVGFIAWLYTSGVYETFDPERLRDWVRNAGAWGGLLFVLSYAFLQPIGLNGLFFMLSAPMIWGTSDAFLLNWLGTIGSGLTAFVFARFMAKDWVQARVPKRMHRFDERLETQGFKTVVFLRLVFFTNPALQFALGISRVRFTPFFWGTLVGVFPFTLLLTLLGVRINAWLDAHPISTWPWSEIGAPLMVGALLLIALGVWFVRSRHFCYLRS